MNPLASIVCFTYNHEKYIRQALEGFLIQKTNFDFEVIIHDDASTDRTQLIIKEYQSIYPRVFFPICQRENQKSKGNGIVTRIAFGAIQGKYVALCEGDDYWNDPHKLQTQVDFLQNNTSYGMVCTDYNILEDDVVSECFLAKNKGMKYDEDISNEDYLLNPYKIRTLTTCFKRSLLESYLCQTKKDEVNYESLGGDVPLWIHISSNSIIKYLAISTSTYRVVPNSASRPSSYAKKYEFSKSILSVKKQYIESNKVSLKVRRKIRKEILLHELTDSYINEDLCRFIKIFLILLSNFFFSKKSIYLCLGLLSNRLYFKISKKYRLL